MPLMKMGKLTTLQGQADAVDRQRLKPLYAARKIHKDRVIKKELVLEMEIPELEQAIEKHQQLQLVEQSNVMQLEAALRNAKVKLRRAA